jgi:hypothetical protein
MIYSFILLINAWIFLIFARLDYTHDVTSSTGSNQGTWKQRVFCPDNTYIYGYNQLQACNSVGTNYIRVIKFHFYFFFCLKH